MRRLIGSVTGLLLLAGCDDSANTCTCTPVGQVETTVEVATDEICSKFAAAHTEEYSSCIENSSSLGTLGPTIALNVEAAPVWSTRWPHVPGSLPALGPTWLSAH
ncbi:MAG: hypothetical protein R2882_11675 [Gemmatimonadales bacterium]